MALRIDVRESLPDVKPDRPTSAGRGDRDSVPSSPDSEPETVRGEQASDRLKSGRAGGTKKGDPLASPQKTVTNRVPADLWEQFGMRAEQLSAMSGEVRIPLRAVLVDALVRALEQPVEEHLAAVKATRRRERLARAEAEES